MANPRCATCKNFGQIENADGSVVTVCERNGPDLKVAPFNAPDGGVQWASFSGWPVVNAANGCSHHVPDILVRN